MTGYPTDRWFVFDSLIIIFQGPKNYEIFVSSTYRVERDPSTLRNYEPNPREAEPTT